MSIILTLSSGFAVRGTAIDLSPETASMLFSVPARNHGYTARSLVTLEVPARCSAFPGSTDGVELNETDYGPVDGKI